MATQSPLFQFEASHDPGGKVRLPKPAHWCSHAEWSGENQEYRQLLSYRWDDREMLLGALMNPSTATTEVLDPTLAKFGRLAQRWGFGGFSIVNACDYRVTDSRLLCKVDKPCSDRNEDAWRSAAKNHAKIVVGYGKLHRSLTQYAARMVEVLRESGKDLYVLDLNKDGSAKHPLYCREDLEPRLWETIDAVQAAKREIGNA